MSPYVLAKGDVKKELGEKDCTLDTLQVQQRLALGLGWVCRGYLSGSYWQGMVQGLGESSCAGKGHHVAGFAAARCTPCRCGEGWSLLAWVGRGQCRGAVTGWVKHGGAMVVWAAAVLCRFACQCLLCSSSALWSVQLTTLLTQPHAFCRGVLDEVNREHAVSIIFAGLAVCLTMTSGVRGVDCCPC